MHTCITSVKGIRFSFVPGLLVVAATFWACTNGGDSESTVMQDGFSWVIEGQIAGLPRPGTSTQLEKDLEFLEEQGIDLLVSLTEEKLDSLLLAEHKIESLHLPVPDFRPPTLEQQIEFVDRASHTLSRGGRVGVHCTAGIGRSGTMLATYLVFLGRSADDAIGVVRDIRPGSIETAEQEESVRAYYDYLQRD